MYFSYFFIIALLLNLGSKAQKRDFFWSASKIKFKSENDLNKWQILSHAKISSMRCTLSPKLIPPKSISAFEPEYTGFKTELRLSEPELVAVTNLRKPGLNLVHQISQILATLLYGCPRSWLTPCLIAYFLTSVAQIQATKLVSLNSCKVDMADARVVYSAKNFIALILLLQEYQYLGQKQEARPLAAF